MALIQRKDRNTTLTKQRVFYADLPSAMPIVPGTADVDSLQNEESVKQSIVNLLRTNRGERVFQPTIGSDINSLLFDNMTPAAIDTVRDFVKSTIKQYEPRAEVLEVNVLADPDVNGVAVSVTFSMLNKSEPVVLDVLLTKVR